MQSCSLEIAEKDSLFYAKVSIYPDIAQNHVKKTDCKHAANMLQSELLSYKINPYTLCRACIPCENRARDKD